jgi:hypothetical protein
MIIDRSLPQWFLSKMRNRVIDADSGELPSSARAKNANLKAPYCGRETPAQADLGGIL